MLMIAALVAAAMGVRQRRRARPASLRTAGVQLPGPVVALARLPVPPTLLQLAHRPDLSRTLVAAGVSGPAAADSLRRARAGGMLLGALMGTALAVLSIPLVLLAPVLVVGLRLLPDRLVTARAAHRRLAIIRALPDLLDLMVICVESGMALDPALRMAAARLGGPLGDEIGATLDMQALGTPRRDAYRALSDRVGSDDVARLVAALMQAEELGTPLAHALAGQAESLRAARRQLARDRAARAAPRIQLVVALVMVPGALLLVLGVMVVELAGQIGAVTG
jgi:tight adherence protein C